MANNQQLKYIFTPSASGRAKGVFYVQVQFKGSNPQRQPLKIDGLTAPNLANWDKKQQRFNGGTQTDVDNNAVLDALRVKCDELLANPQITTPKEFIKALETGITPKDVVTLVDFVAILIEEQKQNPSCNYQLYVSLLHNLLGENHKSTKGKVTYFAKPMSKGVTLADTPLADVGDAQLSDFASWVKTVKGGANYKNLNATLLHVVNVAKGRGKNRQEITYKFRSDAPKRVVVGVDKDKVLTLEQFKAIERLSGSVVNPTGYRNRSYQQLYLDAAMLMYYTNSRPADVLLFRSDMLKTLENGVTVLTYIPYKKRGYNVTEIVELPLPQQALEIVNRYKGKSTGGYLLPFPMNETRWDLTTVEGNKKWRSASNAALGNINAHLKKVGDKIGLNFPLSLYAFRRSAITTTVNLCGNIALVAKRSGTSVKMVSKHYYKDTELQPLAFC